MEGRMDSCNFTCVNLVSFSEPYINNEVRFDYGYIKKQLTYFLYYRIPFVLPLFYSFKSKIKSKKKNSIKSTNQSPMAILNQEIEVGDLIEILQEHEIRAMLDHENKFKGLRFMPEMAQYAGKRFKVIQKVSKIKVESTGELRTIKNPVYLLEGVYCRGEFHEGCERLCFLFWRKEWLRKV
jgi:hypothetical protein